MMFVLIWASMKSYGADSRSEVNYKNQPPPSAIAPSVQSYSQMICSFPVVGAVSTSVVGISTGTTFVDRLCERRQLSKELRASGLTVASVQLLCMDKEVWISMLMSSTPCGIWTGEKTVIGKEAYKYYLKEGYIDKKGNILRFPHYVGMGTKSNFGESNGNRNNKYPK